MAKDTSAVDPFAVPTDFDAEEQVGFAPYWSPSEDPDAVNKFIARIIAKEHAQSETDFNRYLMMAGQDIVCHRGPADDAEEVMVKKGEFFTASVYYSLQGLFDFYIENDFKPWIEVKALEKVKTKKPGQFVWRWKVGVNKKDKAKADQIRAGIAAKQIAEGKKDKEPAELQS